MTQHELRRLVRIHHNLSRFLNVAQQHRDLAIAALMSREGYVIAIQLGKAIREVIEQRNSSPT